VVTEVILVWLAAGLTRALIPPPLPQPNSSYIAIKVRADTKRACSSQVSRLTPPELVTYCQGTVAGAAFPTLRRGLK